MVNVEEIKTAIVEREEDLKNKFKTEKIIEREVQNEIEKLVTTDVALIITGIRRCGKSILAFMLRGRNKGYVNFEDERLKMDEKELNKVLEALYGLKGEIDTIIFDEIQNVEGWERFVTRLLPNKKIVITGSNARLLSKELASFLTGRHTDFTLFPFSFREFLKFKEFKPNVYLTKDIAKIKEFLREYIEKGGFPLTYKVGKIFLAENFSDIVERDVIQRYNVKYPKVMKDLAKYFVTNATSEISFNRLKNILNVKSVHTISKYTDYLQTAYLLFILERFSPKLKEQYLAPKKIFCMDNGIVTSISFRISENFGKLMENLVAIEFLRRKSYWFNDWEIYYWKDYQQREVDFVIKEGLKVKQLIQVTYASSRDEIEKREIKALIKASELLKCKDLLVITWDYEDELKIKNKAIKCLPLWKWLIK
ncbi:MAG: ATP-binding protein [Candidatus Omnitrophica bacterium]|nr:ATP-binding protein [Candidatus Omnitrophota bacterium]